jgi:pimeloyl-ACP methyl ester carboxylesterase
MISSNFISIRGAKIHYLATENLNENPVLFLHGASFQAQTWLEIGILPRMAGAGYSAIAVDLPGYGSSQSLSVARESFLLLLLEALKIDLPVIVSPSMSGAYSFPFLVNYPEKLRGFVAVAPIGIAKYRQQLEGSKVPTLAIWGSNDRIVPAAEAELLVKLMSNADKVLLENAGHACYMRDTDNFYQYLSQFIKFITK